MTTKRYKGVESEKKVIDELLSNLCDFSNSEYLFKFPQLQSLSTVLLPPGEGGGEGKEGKEKKKMSRRELCGALGKEVKEDYPEITLLDPTVTGGGKPEWLSFDLDADMPDWNLTKASEEWLKNYVGISEEELKLAEANYLNEIAEEEKDIEKVAKLYEKALKLQHNLFSILGLIKISNKKGNFEKSLSLINSEMKKYPKDIDSFIELRAEVWNGLGKYKEALKDLETLINTTTDPVLKVKYIFQHANVLQKLGYYDDAIVAYGTILPSDSHLTIKHVPILISRSQAFSDLSKNDLALADLDKALELDPTDTIALSSKIRILEKLGRIEDAISQLDKFISIRPHYPGLFEQREKLVLKAAKERPERKTLFAKPPSFVEIHHQVQPEGSTSGWQRIRSRMERKS